MSENEDKTIRWYVMQVMSGQESKVYKYLRFQCIQDAANVVSAADDAKLNEEFGALFNGLLYGIYELCIPYERVEDRRGSGKEKSASVKYRKLYPGYVLIRMRLYDEEGRLIPDHWNFIKDTKGVIGLIGGQNPVPLTEKEVSDMLRKQKDNEVEPARPTVVYNVGEAVIIKEGAFANCEGTIEVVDQERQRLKVSVSIFGRFTPVEVDFEQVERPE